MANFVLLKEKETGATILVSNSHLDNFSEAARQQWIEKIKADTATTTLKDDVAWVGTEANDTFSQISFKLSTKPA